MRISQSTLYFGAAAVLVVILGALLGWFFFVRSQNTVTEYIDSARGFNDDAGGSAGGGGVFGGGASSGGNAGVGTATGDGGGAKAPRLWKITTTPVAGFAFRGKTSQLSFVERSSGNVLSADPEKTKVSRLTNTLFPKTIEAIFGTADAVILRSIGSDGSIETFAGLIATSTDTDPGGAPGTLEGVRLEKNILAIAPRAGSTTVFFIATNSAGQAVGSLSDWRGGAQKVVLSSAIVGWRPMYLSDGSLYILQKPSDATDGHLFKIRQDRSLERILGGIPGLVALPKARSSAVLYSTIEDGVPVLLGQVSASSTPVTFPVRTIADKCVWADGTALVAYCAVPRNPVGRNFLRTWYAGMVHTTDSIWKLQVSAGTAEEVFVPPSDSSLDVSHVTIDSSGSYLAFTNTKDQTLWMLALNE